MGLFKSDLYRNFGAGFLIGALLVGASMAGDITADIATPAQAAPAETSSESGPASAN